MVRRLSLHSSIFCGAALTFAAICTGVLCIEVLCVSEAHAAALKARSKTVNRRDISQVALSVTVSRRPFTRTISCYQQRPGISSTSRGRTVFTTLADEISFLNRKLRATRKASEKRKIQQEISVKNALRNPARNACAEPEHLSLAEYRGSFGREQAQRLVEVFALGGRPGLADAYAQIGLNAAVNDLLANKPDGEVQSLQNRLTCGPNPYNTTTPDTCFEDGDINDFYMEGVVAGLNWRSVYSNNPARAALFEFLMDQRAPGHSRVLSGCSQWYFRTYLEMMDRAATSGDYKRYVAEAVNDAFLHGKWLSGAKNHSGVVGTGNEDFGREVLELMTTGVTKPDGSDVYTDFDVLQASYALSGLAETEVRDNNDNRICVIAHSPALHRSGNKVLFAGTPQQMVVEDGDDLARELFVAQREQIAYELARRLWGRFISSRGNAIAHQRLARVIIENDFKLWPVMAKMMKSRAFYAAHSAETIMKNPHTLLVSFLRMSGIHASNYRTLLENLRDTGMALGEPPTVFGFSYQNNLLASDIYQLERFNGFVSHAIHMNLTEAKERYNWTPHGALIQGIPLSGYPSVDLVNEMMKRLNLDHSVNGEQRRLFAQFLDYYMGDCPSQQDTECFTVGGARKKLFRSAPDLGNLTDDFYRLRAAYAMAASMPAFGTM